MWELLFQYPNVIRASLLLLLALLTVLPVQARDLRSVAEGSSLGADARNAEQAKAGVDQAWSGTSYGAPPVQAGEGHKTLPAFTMPEARSVLPAPAAPHESIAERRAKLQAGRQPGKFLRGAAYGLGGFLVGALLGWAIGAVVAVGFVFKAPNPSIHKARWALAAPAAIIGAVVGAITMPFLLGYVFSKAEPYPTKGLPENQHHA